jgi:Glycosyltransferase family 87
MKTPNLSQQIAILTLLTACMVLPHLWLNGTNVVTHSYAFGTRQFWLGSSPYANPQGMSDWFKYSPLFAWLYTPYAFLSSPFQSSLWGLTNIFFFWTGVSLWFPWKNLDSKWLWAGFVFCSMEADGSFRYQQLNCALVGLTLVATYLYQQKKYFWAGVLLSFLANIKILPGLFLLGLFFPMRKRYCLGILLSSIICIGVPSLFWGLSKSWTYHVDWITLLTHDTQTDGLLDIATVLKRIGFSDTKLWALYPISILSLIVMLWPRIRPSSFSWDLWMSLGLFSLLLINPRTESPTFVLGGPAYLFLLRFILSLPQKRKLFPLGLWCLGVFFTTFCMNDLWPRVLWDPGSWLQLNKTLGVFLLWFVSLYFSVDIARQTQPHSDLARLK